MRPSSSVPVTSEDILRLRNKQTSSSSGVEELENRESERKIGADEGMLRVGAEGGGHKEFGTRMGMKEQSIPYY